MYKIEDISVIIPTYNRADDLQHKTLRSIIPFSKNLREIIIVDQSKKDETKFMLRSLKNRKIRYVYSKIPSITLARNMGIENVSKKSKIVCFLDDDVRVGRGYFENILKIFNENPEIYAVGGFHQYRKEEMGERFENFIRGMFFISHFRKNDARVISAYGNIYPSRLAGNIRPGWLPGFNTNYRKEIFDKQRFDENLLGYTVAEDIDFTYRLNRLHPHSLMLTPFAEIRHLASTVERYPTERMSYVN